MPHTPRSTTHKHAHKILLAASEISPLTKTGGLGDVCGSLPDAIKSLRRDVRVIMPGYREALQKAGKLTLVAVRDYGLGQLVRVCEGRLPNHVKVYLVDSPSHYDREGGPYLDPTGRDWWDNADRFTLFCRVIADLALDRLNLDWKPDILHCNDWQTGLAPALLADDPARPSTVFTIHNLAYQGIYPREIWTELQRRHSLPTSLWRWDGLEFFNRMCFLKGGLVFSDKLTAVSPSYAEEIKTKVFGHGLEGLLNHRQADLVGILNGIDTKEWDPAHDPWIPQTYNPETWELKKANKLALQRRFGLDQNPAAPLLGMVSRLVEQKGCDLFIKSIPTLMRLTPCQCIVVGTGHALYENALRQLAGHFPNRIAVHIGFSEEVAHWVEAGADMFVMPSRFEPCGLNQMFSLRYGTVPIVRKTGGLADTVINVDDASLKEGRANGFVFNEATSPDLEAAIQRALIYYDQPEVWSQLVRNGMAANFGWSRSARAYVDLYDELWQKRAGNHLT